MAQSDLNVANADGATVRADINSQLEALATDSSGPTPPPVTFPYMTWVDTSGSPVLIKKRNGANTDWIMWGTIITDEVVPYTSASWQDVSASRSLDVTYTNSTGRSIDIAVSCSVQASASATITINGSGVMVASRSSSAGGTDTYAMTARVPNGATYQITTNGTVNFNRWWELR